MPPRRLAALTAAGCALVGALAGCGPSARSSAGSADLPGVDVAPSAAATGSTGSSTAAPSIPTSPSTAPASAPPAAPAAVDPCAARAAAKWVLVDLGEQRLWFCAHRQTVRTTAVTTGMSGPDTSTPTGRFRIEGRNRDTTLTLNTGATYDVKYWIPFQAPLYGFHDSSWQHFPYGSPKYRADGSHGCVHMPLRQIAFLYRWAPIGTPVSIRA